MGPVPVVVVVVWGGRGSDGRHIGIGAACIQIAEVGGPCLNDSLQSGYWVGGRVDGGN